jgi:hypothetical protein
MRPFRRLESEFTLVSFTHRWDAAMLRPTLKESHLFVSFINLARPREDCERVVGVISLDWPKHAKAAPFKRNDQMLDIPPIGVMHFPGTGIQGNLADKAKKLGIPVCERLPS